MKKYIGYELRDGVRLWLVSGGLINVLDGLAFILAPDATRSNAYDWSRAILPSELWGSLFLLLGVCSWVLLWLRHRFLIRLVMLVQVFAMLVFATSILGLTLVGQESAITGANKWAVIAGYGTWLLARPIHDHEVPA